MSQIIEVYFFGLICHIGRDDGFGRTNAAIIKADHHTPKAVLGVPNSAPFEIDLALGDVLSLSLGEDEAGADAQFQAYVPSLLDKTDKPGGNQALKGKVRASKNFDVAFAYFQHTKSSLGVASLYPRRARYEMNHKPASEQCVAQLAFATTETDEETVYLIRDNDGQKTKYPFRDGWLLIINSIHTHVFGNSGQHFGQQKNLTDANEIAMVSKGGSCDDAATVKNGVHRDDVLKYVYSHSLHPSLVKERPNAELDLLDATQVECSDTRWP